MYNDKYSNAVLPSENKFSKRGNYKKEESKPPTTPIEKYLLRVSVGRQTGRMDLSCKAVWLEKEQLVDNEQKQEMSTSPDTLPVVSSTTDDESVENEEGLFSGIASHRNDEDPEEAAALQAQLQEVSRNVKDNKTPMKHPKEMVLDFRLSKIPRVVLKLTGLTHIHKIHTYCSFSLL